MASIWPDRQALASSGLPIFRAVWVSWDEVDTGSAKPAKVPFPPGAQKRPECWSTLAAIPADRRVGLIIAACDLTLIDVDGLVRLTAEQAAAVRPMIEASSLVTRSHSGTGLHLWFAGSYHLPATFYHHPSGARVEVYSGHSTGRFIAETGVPWRLAPGKGLLPPEHDECDVPALLRGWTAAADRRRGELQGLVGPLEAVAAPSWRDARLDALAASLDALARDPGASLAWEGRTWRGGRSDARWWLLKQAARAAPSQEELVAWAALHLPTLYGERADPAREVDVECAKAWADTGADLVSTLVRTSKNVQVTNGGDDDDQDQDDGWPKEGDQGQAAGRDEPRRSLPARPVGRQDGGPIRDVGTQGHERQIPAETTHASLSAGFVRDNKGKVLYVDQLKRWYGLNKVNGLWVPDRTLAYQERIARYLSIMAERLTEGMEKEGEVAKTRDKLLSFWNLVAVTNMAKPGLAVVPELFDANPWLLGTPAGVVDLRTGETRLADPTEYITLSTNVVPDFSGPPVAFLKFMGRIFRQHPEMIGFLQRCLGMCLSGDVTEHKLIFCHGGGRNGKTTLLELIKAIMGSYAHGIGSEMMMQRSQPQHPTELAQLQGKRLVTASEIDSSAVWNESRLKDLTGGDEINARVMRGDFFTFTPTHHLVMFGNHKPAFRQVGPAIRARMLLIPFLERIGAEERDPALRARLLVREGGRILAWLIEGCMMWQKDGLQPPSFVIAETERYLDEEDQLTQWLKARTVLQVTARTDRAALARDFADWTLRSMPDQRPWPARRFYSELENNGFYEIKVHGQRIITGLSLRPDDEPDALLQQLSPANLGQVH